jgi:hypothetical protein
MSMAACLTAIQGVWTANWARTEPVRWHQNTGETIPAAGTYPHWLHLAVEFAEEEVVAFGAGRGLNERRLRGSVVIRGYAESGRGETTLLAMLDAAVAAFRSKRVGDLSFVGVMVLPEPGASKDGNWWIRTGIAPFEYRFRG